jgi:hypothetical protein
MEAFTIWRFLLQTGIKVRRCRKTFLFSKSRASISGGLISARNQILPEICSEIRDQAERSLNPRSYEDQEKPIDSEIEKTVIEQKGAIKFSNISLIFLNFSFRWLA